MMPTPTGHNPPAFARLLLLTLLCCLAIKAGAAAELSVDVPRQQIALGDHLQVTFELRGSNPQEPDFSPLQQDFEILAVASGSRVIMVNGETDRYYEWRLTLTPRHTGTLTLPPIEVAGARSRAVDIQVTEPQANSTDAETFLQVEAHKSRVYVQEEVLLTLKLYSKIQWRNKGIASFDLPDTLVKAVAEDEYVSNLGGTPHLVYEVTLAVYPQKSGTLEIPALQYEIEPARGGRSLLSDFYGTGERMRGSSQPLSVEVEPSPADTRGPWIPAREVSLSEHFSHDPQDLKAGEPITRRITLKAEGLSKSQLPELPLPELDGFNFYRDQAQTREEPGAGGITSERVETIAMVPSREGRFTLPAVEVRWWNTETGQFETATLPEKNLRVSLPAGYTPPTQAAADTPDAPAAASDPGKVETVATIPLWLQISQTLTAALLLLFILLWWRARRRAPDDRPRAAGTPADQSLWRRLKQASAAGDLKELRAALLAWFSQAWHEDYRSLEAVAQHCRDTELATALRQLDRALYSGTGATFDSGALLQKIQKLRVDRRDNPNTGKLAPLYPE